MNKMEKDFASNNNQDKIRLNKYIANAGICSRREADELIKNGYITVNDHRITAMGHLINPQDVVKYNKKILKKQKFVYILLNKPKNYITTTNDPQSRNTVMDLIKGATNERVHPVGRLDRNTSGLLILTNDGELTQKITHPSFNIKKIYSVVINKPLTNRDADLLVEGIELDDGKHFFDEIVVVDKSDKTKLGLLIHSGANRVIRRMFEKLGYEVLNLDRTAISSLTKKNLPRGKYRYLTNKEINILKHRKHIR